MRILGIAFMLSHFLSCFGSVPPEELLLDHFLNNDADYQKLIEFGEELNSDDPKFWAIVGDRAHTSPPNQEFEEGRLDPIRLQMTKLKSIQITLGNRSPLELPDAVFIVPRLYDTPLDQVVIDLDCWTVRGFLHTKGKPSPLVRSIEEARSTKGDLESYFLFREIAQNWYLYEEKSCEIRCISQDD